MRFFENSIFSARGGIEFDQMNRFTYTFVKIKGYLIFGALWKRFLSKIELEIIFRISYNLTGKWNFDIDFFRI